MRALTAPHTHTLWVRALTALPLTPVHPARLQVGEVSNRRAWHDTGKLTQEVLDLYKAPLRVEGWDTALMETTRLKRDFTQADLTSYFGDCRALPALVVTGTGGGGEVKGRWNSLATCGVGWGGGEWCTGGR